MKHPSIIAIKSFLCLFLVFLSTSCTSFEQAAEAEEVKAIAVTVKVSSAVSGIDSLEGLVVVFEDVKYGTRKEAVLTGNETRITGVTAGMNNIKITGKAIADNGDIYLMSIKGSGANNFLLTKEEEYFEFDITGLRENHLLFKEIYFAGSRTATNSSYFRDQFYEVYNNSPEEVIYLDGVYFANLTPSTATAKLPVWPETDGDRYAYAERVWKFPGNGTDYPLQPGESCIIAQYAVNHQVPLYNPNSPVNCASAEFEFNMGHPNFPDQPAVNMLHIFNDGEAVVGSLAQYLTSVFGGAYVLFKPLSGEEYDPVLNPELKTQDLSVTRTTLYAKIPVDYIIDAVEAGHDENKLNAKRVPSVLDAGMTYVGTSYNGLGVARKLADRREDGTPILQDTNNSTEDFERGVVPVFRRYEAKKPVWSQSFSR